MDTSKYKWLSFAKYGGIETPDGWNDILVDLFDGIDKLVKDTDAKICLNQAKEKFGSLRFYHTKENIDTIVEEQIDGLIDAAEVASETTCVVCGAPGIMEHVGWISPRCSEHSTKK